MFVHSERYGSSGNNARYEQQGEVAKSQAEQKRVQKLQAEVDEVAVILHTTVDKLLERGEKLDDLMDGAGMYSHPSLRRALYQVPTVVIKNTRGSVYSKSTF